MTKFQGQKNNAYVFVVHVHFSNFPMYTRVMKLSTHQESYAICRLSPDAPFPDWATGQLVSLSRTADELSVVCQEDSVPNTIKHERNWRVLQVEGPMDLSIIGVLASLTKPLAEAGINLFAISTFDTDYLLVKAEKYDAAKAALEGAGHEVQGD
jgi:hypothetical protein